MIINAGAAAGSSADEIKYDNSESGLDSENVQEAIDELFTSVSNGKKLVASAITDMGVSTASNATFQTMATNISNISNKPTLLWKNSKPNAVSSDKLLIDNAVSYDGYKYLIVKLKGYYTDSEDSYPRNLQTVILDIDLIVNKMKKPYDNSGDTFFYKIPVIREYYQSTGANTNEEKMYFTCIIINKAKKIFYFRETFEEVRGLNSSDYYISNTRLNNNSMYVPILAVYGLKEDFFN